MLIKAGVDISRLLAPIRKQLTIIARIIAACDQEELTITSTYEGNHLPSSMHYANLAIDIRRFAKAKTTRDEIARNLGPDYYVYLAKTHIHIGYTPK